MAWIMIYLVLLFVAIIFAWGFFKLLKMNQEKSDLINKLRLELYVLESKDDLENFKQELRRIALENEKGEKTDE